MKLIIRTTLTLLLIFLIPSAFAAINCTIASTGVSSTYLATSTSSVITQGFFSFVCSKGVLDPNNTTYTLTLDNGLNSTGGQNNASFSGSLLPYDNFQQSNCSSSTFPSASVTSNGTTNINYWSCITTLGQFVPAGTSTDTVTVSVTYTNPGLFGLGANKTTSNVFPVTINNTPICKINSIENVVFGNYQAFRATPLAATSANVVITCNLNLNYSLSLDANSGVVAGLNYALSLSPISTSGSGVGKTHVISGTMPANQAGTCATGTCPASSLRTLTITY